MIKIEGQIEQQLEEIRDHLRPVEWSPSRSDRVFLNIQSRRRRFTLSTVALGSAAVAVAVVVAIVWFAQGRSTQPTQNHASVMPPMSDVLAPKPLVVHPAQIELSDGTRATPLGSGSHVRLVEETDSLVAFQLDSGKAWFGAIPAEDRRIEVKIRDLRIEVLGTELVVEVQDDVVHVWVHQGRVVVTSSAGTITLQAGEEQRFSVAKESMESEPGNQGVSASLSGASSESGSESSSGPGSESSSGPGSESSSGPDAESSSGAAAKRQVEPSQKNSDYHNGIQVRQTLSIDAVAELWRDADAARLAGDHKQAVRVLLVLVNEHKEDPRAALAAFSLGRVLLDTNDSPKTAARAFAKARKLSPNGPLVEDALFREIESWYGAGDQRRVNKRAEKYQRLFPSGRYTKQIAELTTARPGKR